MVKHKVVVIDTIPAKNESLKIFLLEGRLRTTQSSEKRFVRGNDPSLGAVVDWITATHSVVQRRNAMGAKPRRPRTREPRPKLKSLFQKSSDSGGFDRK